MEGIGIDLLMGGVEKKDMSINELKYFEIWVLKF